MAGLCEAACYAPQKLYIVTLDQVSEHASDPAALLRNVHQVLKPGGQAIVSTPNPNGWGAKLFGRRWIHWHAPYHLKYFTRHLMKRLAAKVGFDLELVRVVHTSAWIEYPRAQLVTFPRLGPVSPFMGR